MAVFATAAIYVSMRALEDNRTGRSQPPYGEEEERTLEALSRTPPPLIVDSFKTVKMPDREGWGALLAQHYRLLQDAHGARLYLRKGL